MRLLIALPDSSKAGLLQDEMESAQWNVSTAADGPDVLRQLSQECFDLLLLHRCLPCLDGIAVGEWLRAQELVCPPRVLFVGPCEWQRPRWADASVDAASSTERLCALMRILAQKPLSKLAAAQEKRISGAVESFLDQIGLKRRYKGYAYTAWLLGRIIPSPLLQEMPLNTLYLQCAEAFHTNAAAVERCVRIAVENIFTQGSMLGIEQFFGATVDPEKGKPTNRAFLCQAASRLRMAHSLADARSPNNSVMHHKPAAPTSV